MRILLLATLLSTAVPLLPAQAASVAFYGTGCAYAGQTLAIGVQGLPQIGTTFTLTYTGPNFYSTLTIQPFLAIGFAPEQRRSLRASCRCSPRVAPCGSCR